MNANHISKISKALFEYHKKDKALKNDLREAIQFKSTSQVKVNTIKIAEILSKIGFHKNGENRSLTFDFFSNGILYQNIARGDIHNIIMKFVKKDKHFKLHLSDINNNIHIYLVKNTTIINNIEYFKVKKYFDKPDCIRLFFKSQIIKISLINTEIKIKKETYDQFKKKERYISADNIIDFDYSLNKKENTSIINKLFTDITNNKKHYLSLKTFIGFNLSNYKSLRDKTILIISDEKSQIFNEAHGQSCKSLLINVLGKVKKVSSENGRDFNKNFPFQMATKDTEIMVFGDAHKDFPLSILYELKDGMHIEYKGKGKHKIPYNESAKVLLTTNHNLGTNTSSDKGRIYRININNFFNDNNTPSDAYNQELFTDWDNNEWNSFYSLMIDCAATYLKRGLIEYINVELGLKQLENQTSIKFITEITNVKLNEWYQLNSFSTKCIETSTHRSSSQLSIIVSKWINIYCEINKLKYHKESKNQNKTYFKITEAVN